MKSTTAYHKSYDLNGWEGGIAVYVANGDHGTKIVSIPRLGLSTALIGPNESYAVEEMLMRNRTMYSNPQEMDYFASLILRDIKQTH